MCPGQHDSLWVEFDAFPAPLLKKAVGTSVVSGGSGGALFENIDLYAEPFPLVARCPLLPKAVIQWRLIPDIRTSAFGQKQTFAFSIDLSSKRSARPHTEQD
jgi:hypothetical protein